MSKELENETRMVTLCHISGWHEWAKHSPAVRAKHDRGVRDGIGYFDCPFCPSTHSYDAGEDIPRTLLPAMSGDQAVAWIKKQMDGTRIEGRTLKSKPMVDDDGPLPPLIPESWSACAECRVPCADDFCSESCRAEWTNRWYASGRDIDEQQAVA